MAHTEEMGSTANVSFVHTRNESEQPIEVSMLHTVHMKAMVVSNRHHVAGSADDHHVLL